ncbi:MAG: hypothetical protein Q9176_008016 [Flavoplaca citrina]
MACVNLLSSPSGGAVPASISPFLAKLLLKACQSPSADSIRPIYKILAGSSPHLLDALPSDIVVQMQDQCNVMLQKLKIEVNGSCASFFCLALCAVISGGDTPGPVSEEQASAAPPPTTASTRTTIPAASRYEARKYFVSKRASKTLDFTVLRMIYLCSENRKLSIPDIVESLELSNVILKAVNETDRAIWIGKHQAIISKLVEKVISYNHSPEILCMAALVLVESFAISIATSTSLRHKVLYLLSTNALACPLRRFLALKECEPSNQVRDDHLAGCSQSYAKEQMLLRRHICIMLIRTCFFSQHDTLSLDSSTASSLLDMIANTERTYRNCQSCAAVSHSSPQALVPLFETGSTPCSSAESDLWRHRLRNELAQNAEYQYQGVIRTVEDICQDLERRCIEVEAPLRDEKARSRKLHTELEASRLQVAKLSAHTHEQSLILEGIEGEKSELLARVADLEHEQNELSGRSEELRQQLAKAIQQAEDADRIRIKEVRDLELIQAAVVAERDEILEAQERKDKDSRARNDGLEEEIAELQAKGHVHRDNTRCLEATISEQQTEICSMNTLMSEKQQSLARLEDLLDNAKTESSNLQIEVTHLSDTCQALREELKQKAATVDSQLAELNNLRCHHEAESSAQIHKVIHTTTNFDIVIWKSDRRQLAQLERQSDQRAEEFERQLSKQTEDAALAIQQRDSRLLQLEDKLATLQGDLDDRENELEEAQALNDQVVKFWSKRRNAVTEELLTRHNSKTFGSPQQKRTSVRFPKESPEHRRNRTTRPSNSSSLSKRRGKGSDELGGSASCNKATPRRPLADVDGGLQTRLNISPIRSSPRKATPKNILDESNGDENTQSGMAEGSVYDSQFFSSADQHLIGKMHDNAPHFGLPDDTTEL